jgi:hypothetical protein
MESPELAPAMMVRSEPLPLSAVLVTVQEAAARPGAAHNSSSTIP